MEANPTDAEIPVRIRDQMKGQPSVKRKSDDPEKVRERNLKRKRNSQVQRGRLEYYYKEERDKIELLNKLDTVKLYMGEGKLGGKVSTFEALHRILDFFVESHHLTDPTAPGPSSTQCRHDGGGDDEEEDDISQFLHLPRSSAEVEDIFMCTPTALHNLVQRMQVHGKTCKEPLVETSSKRLRHASLLTFTCQAKHVVQWTSSPYIDGGKLLVNVRLSHALFSSGMLPIQYEKFCDAANIGVLGESYLNGLQPSYAGVVHAMAEKSQEQAMHEEIAYSHVESEGGKNGY